MSWEGWWGEEGGGLGEWTCLEGKERGKLSMWICFESLGVGELSEWVCFELIKISECRRVSKPVLSCGRSVVRGGRGIG